METITINVRRGLDAVSEITDRPGMGRVLGMISRTGRGDNTTYTPLDMDMQPLGEPQTSSAAAIEILTANAAPAAPVDQPTGTAAYKQHPGTPLGYSAVYDVVVDGNKIGEVRKTDPAFYLDTAPVFEAYAITGQRLGTGTTRRAATAHITG